MPVLNLVSRFVHDFDLHCFQILNEFLKRINELPILVLCTEGRFNCKLRITRILWRNSRRNGQKIKFPPIEVPEKISLALSVGFNASGKERKKSLELHTIIYWDTTFGWHGFHDGFQIYYKHFTHVLEDQAHSVLLSQRVFNLHFQNFTFSFLLFFRFFIALIRGMWTYSGYMYLCYM